MLLRSKFREMSYRQLIRIGFTLLLSGILITAVGSRWLNGPDFLVGFLYGIASGTIGLSIVFNLLGLKRYRTKQANH